MITTLERTAYLQRLGIYPLRYCRLTDVGLIPLPMPSDHAVLRSLMAYWQNEAAEARRNVWYFTDEEGDECYQFPRNPRDCLDRAARIRTLITQPRREEIEG